MVWFFCCRSSGSVAETIQGKRDPKTCDPEKNSPLVLDNEVTTMETPCQLDQSEIAAQKVNKDVKKRYCLITLSNE